MLYQECVPHPGLKNHIKCYWTLTISAAMLPSEGQSFLAEGVEFSFNLADPIEFITHGPESATARHSFICGPMTQLMWMRPSGRVEIFGVCFRPGGANPFFTYPANELANSYVEIDDLWGTKGLEIVERIHDSCNTTKERIDFLDRYFLRILDKYQKNDAGIAAALDIIEGHSGHVNIDRLATLVGLSSRQLERLFKERVGMSPKQLCRNLRFKNVFKYLAKSPTDWVSTALACGYYDQSHLIKDFKHYTGISPAAYFTDAKYKEKFFTGNF